MVDRNNKLRQGLQRSKEGMTMNVKHIAVVFLMMVTSGALCIAQISPEEAQQKLQDKIAAENQPETLQAQIKSLQAQIDDLKQQLAAAKAENAQLKEKLGVAQSAAPANAEPATVPQSTFTSRAKGVHWSFNHNPEKELADAQQTDAQIDALAAEKGLKPDMVASMHEGKPMIGMPEEGLEIIMTLKKQADSDSGTTYLGWTKQQVQMVWQTVPGPAGTPIVTNVEGVDYSKWPRIIVKNGVVTRIDEAQ
jgi:outer membrane murein-binding lipoprotein Lpp